MYLYDNEDNAAMMDERWEAEREHSAQRMDERWAEKLEKAAQKQRNAIDGLADMLGLTGDCRGCPSFTELAEGFIDRNGLISNEQVDFLKSQCFSCGGMGTGKPKDEQHEKWRDRKWQDIMEWVKLNDLKFRCCWCPNVYRIYGQYKDPDDEWKAIEKACCNCKYFGED